MKCIHDSGCCLSLAHMSILPFYIAILPLSGLNCSAPATFQVSKQRVALTHVPLTCLSLQSCLSRPPSVSRPSEGNSRFTSLSSVPDIRKSVQHKVLQLQLCASSRTIQCKNTPTYSPRSLGSSISY